MSWGLGPRPPALWAGIQSPGDRQEKPEARGSGPAPFRVSGGKTTGDQLIEIRTALEAGQLLLSTYGVEYGKVTLFGQGGKLTHLKVEHDIQPVDADRRPLRAD